MALGYTNQKMNKEGLSKGIRLNSERDHVHNLNQWDYTQVFNYMQKEDILIVPTIRILQAISKHWDEWGT